ncbi:NADH dehydrogenase subunit 5 [Iris pallida]|uniref:NADH dehydrogenase subunit 5 (Plastid) n=1 Tax=Iris pallida TaxID=29817 RepID=A0AAX6FQ25_IRIPA|nr:NADH dehydrogenase subunit 5 [Iris pallida]
MGISKSPNPIDIVTGNRRKGIIYAY